MELKWRTFSTKTRWSEYFAEIWYYRELCVFLAWRDLIVRYRHAVIGLAWVVVRPVLTAAIFTLIFHRIVKLPGNDSLSYTLIVFAGVLPWQFFSSATSEGANYLVDNPNLVQKIYFPKSLMPLSSLLSSFLDFAIVLALFLFTLVLTSRIPSPTGFLYLLLIALPLLLLTTAGVTFLLAGLNIRFRDFRYAIPFLFQLGAFVSPLGFKSELIPADLRYLFYLNPMTGIIDLFRHALLGESLPASNLLCISIFSSAFFLAIGVFCFERVERNLADSL